MLSWCQRKKSRKDGCQHEVHQDPAGLPPNVGGEEDVSRAGGAVVAMWLGCSDALPRKNLLPLTGSVGGIYLPVVRSFGVKLSSLTQEEHALCGAAGDQVQG